MAFEDVAKRMQARHEGDYGGTPTIGSGDSSGAGGQIALGLILLIVGIAITAVTHGQASRQGGTYVIAYGPMIWGAITMIRGLIRLGG
jgi:hypothetical protein